MAVDKKIYPANTNLSVRASVSGKMGVSPKNMADINLRTRIRLILLPVMMEALERLKKEINSPLGKPPYPSVKIEDRIDGGFTISIIPDPALSAQLTGSSHSGDFPKIDEYSIDVSLEEQVIVFTAAPSTENQRDDSVPIQQTFSLMLLPGILSVGGAFCKMGRFPDIRVCLLDSDAYAPRPKLVFTGNRITVSKEFDKIMRNLEIKCEFEST